MNTVFYVIWFLGIICLLLLTEPYHLTFWQAFGMGGLWMCVIQLFILIGGK